MDRTRHEGCVDTWGIGRTECQSMCQIGTKASLPTTFGKYSWPSGEVYESEFVDIQAHGNGYFISKDRDWSIEGHVIICAQSICDRTVTVVMDNVVAVAGCEQDAPPPDFGPGRWRLFSIMNVSLTRCTSSSDGCCNGGCAVNT